MKTEKKSAWRNQKCNDCGKQIFTKLGEENLVYFLHPKFASLGKTWKICESCYKKIFKEEKEDG